MAPDESLEQMKKNLEKMNSLSRRLNDNLDREARDIFQNMSPQEVAEYVHKNDAMNIFTRYLSQITSSPERFCLVAEAVDEYERIHKK